LSGRSGNRLFKTLGGAAAWLLDGYYIGNEENSGDRKANHAERKIVRRANPPMNALLSVGASRAVCSTCTWVLLRRVTLYGGCFGPIGSRRR
jgi:hypothetical protein